MTPTKHRVYAAARFWLYVDTFLAGVAAGAWLVIALLRLIGATWGLPS